MLVRRLAHKLGYRYRLHCHDLPGKPDLVFPRRRAVIFVHGCFWHDHHCPKGRKRPVANAEWWDRKLKLNRLRDEAAVIALENAGWRVLVLWECELRAQDNLTDRLRTFLG
ncbi:DNA mismatch endonuclease Vsr [Methylobacterium sp. B1]|uniref:very short patch repair endonuclease n=1 Tax=Methylobacterium sp. B1 TaxID=91459 RepID=UPI00278C83B8|nr:DNA mismatch endonuclease Vsr [Methylobacterium sp. B1]